MVNQVSLLEQWRERALHLEREVKQVIIGQNRAIRLLTISIFSRGHVLLEGDVGVGKTTLLRAIARAIGGAYERLEGTIDLMPTDLIYYTYVNEDGKPRVAPGPLLKHGENLSTFFFNEVNRARPQVHSLLLRVMAERSVSAFNRDYRFPHLQVFADRNRLEKEETFEIPFAARDRFLMEVQIKMPEEPAYQRQLMMETRFHDVDELISRVTPGVFSYTQLNEIGALIQTEIQTSDTLQEYALNLSKATRSPGDFGIKLDDIEIDHLVQAGISPRGMSMMLRAARVAAWLQDRSMVIPEDLHEIFHETVTHRVFLNPIFEMHRSQIATELTAQILNRVVTP